MTSEIVQVVARPSALSTEHAALAKGAMEFIAASRSANSLRAYAGDFQHFEDWCVANGLASLPALPKTLGMYVTDLAHGTAPHARGRERDGYVNKPKGKQWKARTISRKCCAISFYHRKRGHPDPTKHEDIKSLLEGVRNTLGTRVEKKKPLLPADMKATVAVTPATDIRDVQAKAVVLLCFAAAMRRSEACALMFDDVEFTSEGLRLTIRFSKADKEGKGVTMGISKATDPLLCPVTALRDWLAISRVSGGYLFRSLRYNDVREARLSPGSVAKFVKAIAKSLTGDDAAYSGHSLRAGWATAAAQAGVPLDGIMRRTRHKTAEVALGYIREAELFTRDPGKGLL